METLTIGNLLTIITIIIGLVVQYVAIINKFSERLTRLEVKYDSLKETIDKNEVKFSHDIDSLFDLTRNMATPRGYTKEVSSEP